MLSLVGVGTSVNSVRRGGMATVNSLTSRASLTFPAGSVTTIVQSPYVPSLNGVELSDRVRETGLSPDDAADEVELPQAPPYVMVPASVEWKV